MKNERPKSSKGGLRSSMQNKVQSSHGIHQRSNANIKPQPVGRIGEKQALDNID